MKILAVVLEKDQRLGGALAMRTYRTAFDVEVHYEPELGVVVITKKDVLTALVVPISKVDHLEVSPAMARAITEPPKAKGA